MTTIQPLLSMQLRSFRDLNGVSSFFFALPKYILMTKRCVQRFSNRSAYIYDHAFTVKGIYGQTAKGKI